MKSFRTMVFAVAVFSTFSVGCATAYDKCVAPEITAATKLAPADVAKEVAAFLICDAGNPSLLAPCAVSGLADLAVALGPGGDAAVNCLVAYFEQNGTGLQQARAKAVGAKRGVTPSACNGIPPGVRVACEGGNCSTHGRI